MEQSQNRVPSVSGRSTKINRVSIVDQVCSSIKQDIADGVWQSGDKLPSEAEFADTFGVNRLSVRMALQKLNTLGIIETRVGEGSFVCHFSLKPVLSELSPFYEGEERYKDVQQLRNLLEYECMRLAAISASEEEKSALKEALKQYNDCSAAYNENMDDKKLLEHVIDADFNFHYKVVKMSHNKLYKDIYYMVQQLIRSHITNLVSRRSVQRKNAGLPPLGENDTHNKIYDCIINSDMETLHQLMEELLGIIPAKGLDIFD
ncbi:FadR/GntR family transcriptional regulator [Dysosmobacter sp.]